MYIQIVQISELSQMLVFFDEVEESVYDVMSLYYKYV